ncbi:GntR family transcriptional regulator [Haliea sp.]|uniref:FadR/GntR family transcriptional regulator n=1 Tax=Haliea sp. TaxID=1932666 RepID=UPI0025B97DBD|nr:GntR family transcriptional regulator [Haliea sp.]|tara:strand:+ start:89555 stop:90286 length:732 start_codon:yes stop_codon:yes gene_type:complete
MPNTALQRDPLYRQIYKILETRILSNELKVGDTLPAEQVLADNLQVHRSSVREAMRLLEENGLVERKPGGKKLIVRSPDRDKLSSRIFNTLILEEVTVRELYEAIRILDAEIATVAAEKISPELLHKMEENLRQTEANLGDNAALEVLDLEFHSLIAEGSCNRVLQLSRLGIAHVFLPAANRLMKQLDVNQRLLDAHRQIYRGLRDHDPEQVRTWVLKHADDFVRGYEVAGLDLDAPVSFTDQ